MTIMKKIIYKLRASYLAVLAGLVLLSSCNKDLEQFAPIPTPVYPTGNGIAATLAANPTYSNYAALIARAGLTASLNDLTKTFTLIATNNNGMNLFANAASGGLVPYPAPDAVVLGFINGSLPVASAAGIVQYNTIGQKFTFGSFGTTFPNYPITSQIILDPNQPFVRMPIFPDGGTPYSYVNTMPVIATDMAAANGIIHTSFSIVAPPTAVLKTMIAAEPTLSYFRAAVARADSGSVGLSRFDSLLNYGVTNMTVLAPNDAAFQTLVFGLVYAQVFAATGNAILATATANGAVAAGPAFLSTNNVSTALVRGIVAYHLLASLTTSTTSPYQPNIRVFSNNISGTAPVFIKTLVNGSLAIHPGVSAQSTYTGPAATSIAFKGYGTFPPGGAPYSGPAATTVSIDKHAVNGVYHIINSVLLPQ
jgi:Fasciclin domain